MSDKKISQLTSASTPLTGSEELAIVQSGSTVKATSQDIADLASGDPVFNIQALYESGVVYQLSSDLGPSTFSLSNVVLNLIGLGNPSRYRAVTIVSKSIVQVKNASLLTNLENIGTSAALNLNSNSMTATEINSLFTQLPVTTKTATINVAGNPGAATCTPSIATLKGYTVVV